MPSSASTAELDPHQRERLERQLQRERAQAVYDRALRAHDQGIQQLKTARQGKRGDTAFEETVTREVLPSPQHLRTAIQASRELDRIADKPAPPAPPKPEETQQQRWREVLDALYTARLKAEDEKKVTHGNLDHISVVDYWLAALLGDRPDYFYEGDIAPGTALHELATFYQPETCNVEPETCPSQPETWNVEPETSSPSNPSTASNLAPSEPLPSALQLEPTPGLTPSHSIQNQKSQIQNLYQRRLARQRKLEQYRAAVQSGLPYMMHWDPEDVPPPPVSHHLDDYGYQPSPTNKEDEAQMVKDYLAKLRAECRANA